MKACKVAGLCPSGSENMPSNSLGFGRPNQVSLPLFCPDIVFLGDVNMAPESVCLWLIWVGRQKISGHLQCRSLYMLVHSRIIVVISNYE